MTQTIPEEEQVSQPGITNSASGGRGVAEFVMLQTLLVGGGGGSRVCQVTNSASGGRGVAEFVTNSASQEQCQRINMV